VSFLAVCPPGKVAVGGGGSAEDGIINVYAVCADGTAATG
jgi:hypothetical protein